jgi:hypothetical protein
MDAYPLIICASEKASNTPDLSASIYLDMALMGHGRVLVEAVSPVALEDSALTVQQELQSRLREADRLRLKQVERLIRVDPPAGGICA